MAQVTTNFLQKECLQEETFRILSDIKAKYSNLQEVLSEKMVPLPRDSYHTISRLLIPRTREERLVYDLFYSAISKIEKMSGGSSQMALIFGVEFLLELLKHRDLGYRNHVELMKEWHEVKSHLKEISEELCTPPTKTFVEDFVKSRISEQTLAETTLKSLHLAGLDGSIFVEDGKTTQYGIEVKDGYSFPLKTYSFFLKNQEVTLNDARVILVDGVIETVGEIDQLLLSSMQEGSPLIIFAQGFHEEILSTLYQNLQMGRLNAYAVKIPIDIESLNVVNDLAYVCGSDVVSCLNGQRVSATSWEDLKIVPKVRLTENQTTIWNPKTKSSVSLRIKDLIQQRNRSIPEIQEFIDKRLQSLCPSSVIIHLPAMDRIQSERTKTEIDLCLRSVKTLLSHGSVSLSEVTERFVGFRHQSELKRALDRVLMTLNQCVNTYGGQVPVLGLILAVEICSSTLFPFFLSAGFIKKD